MAIRLKDVQKAYARAGYTLTHSDSTHLGSRPAPLAEINYALHRDPLVATDAVIAEKDIGGDDQDEQAERRKEAARRKGIR